MNQSFSRAAGMLLVLCSLALPSAAAAQDGHKVTGTVTDETGATMIGMTVIVTGTTVGATTDIDGHYEIEVPADGSLTFSYLGYQSQEVAVEGRAVIDISMVPDAEVLTDAIVIGYGTTTKRDMTGSLSSVNTKDFNEGLISSPEQLINGKVSGVQILSSGGSPTSGSTIRIRGGRIVERIKRPSDRP